MEDAPSHLPKALDDDTPLVDEALLAARQSSPSRTANLSDNEEIRRLTEEVTRLERELEDRTFSPASAADLRSESVRRKLRILVDERPIAAAFAVSVLAYLWGRTR